MEVVDHILELIRKTREDLVSWRFALRLWSMYL